MKRFPLISIVVLSLLAALVSCDQNPVTVDTTPTIRGTVSIPAGANVSGSDFFIRIMEGDKVVHTGRVSNDGSFKVSGLEEGKAYSILLTTEEPGDIGSKSASKAASSNGYGGWLNDVTASMNEQAGVGSVKVKPLGTIKGIVKKDGANDGYDTTAYIPGTSFLAMTDADGSFSIYNVPQSAKPYTIRFTSSGYMPRMVDGIVLHSDDDTANPVANVPGTITLVKNAGNLVWTITKTGTSDHSGTTVMLTDGTNSYTGSTSNDGSLLISGIEPGTYNATVTSSGFVTKTVDGIQMEAGRNTTMDSLSLLANGGNISGTVSIKGLEDLSGVLITAMDNSEGYSYVAATDKEGSYLFLNVHPGVYSLGFSKAGYDTITREEVSSVAGQTTKIDLSSNEFIRSTGAVAGFVSLKGQTSAVGTRVEIKSVSSITTTYSATVDSNGMFEIPGVEPRSYYLVATKDGFIPSSPIQVTVEKGKVSSIDSIVLVNERVTVKGSVVLDGSASHEGSAVLLSNKDSNGESPSTTTNERGEYVFSDVAPGTYRVIASKDGFATETTDYFDVEASVDRTINAVTLKVATRSITGRVQLEERTQHSGVLITATNVDKTSLVYSAISNADGNFTLAGMDAGKYDITFSSQGFLSVTEYSVDVVKGSSLELGSMDLELARGRIEGYVKLEGRTDHSGTKVILVGRKDRADGVSYTDSYGFYSLNVPSGNYPIGLSFFHEDFESGQDVRTITVLTGSTYGIDSVPVLTATAVPIVSGTVDVKGTDDNGDVNVSIQGTDYTMVTYSDGVFKFEHVPIGNYTLKLSRENTPDVFVPFEVKASASISLGSISMIPNSATLSGKASLRSVDNYRDILVTVTSIDGSVTVSGTTDDAGYYYISNVLSSVDHTVTFSKEGWDSQSTNVTGLKALESRTLDDVELVDTTDPVLKSITINNGSNTTADKNVVIHIDAEDSGSGCGTIMISDFNSSDSISYANTVDWTLEGANGEKTIYVKVIDRAGNESNTLSATVALTDQKTEVKGVLKGDNLTWTKKMSPYLVTSNLLVERGDVLKIEPGVDIQFEGDYYLQVEGSIEAKGTEDDRISFYGIGAGEDNWYGIKALGPSDVHRSVLDHVSISGLKSGIIGYCDIDHAEISANGFAIGSSLDQFSGEVFRGNILNSVIKGNVHVYGGNSWHRFVANNKFNGEVYLEYANVEDNTFEGAFLRTSYCFVYNNYVSSEAVVSYLDIQQYVTYNNSDMKLDFRKGGPYSSTEVSTLSRIQFNNCTFEMFVATINESNFIDCGSIVISSGRKELLENDATGNYWGELNTSELELKGENSNLSFINDYYDDFNKTKVLCSGWKTTAISDIGYRGRESSDVYSGYSIGDEGPAGGLVFFDKGFYSSGWRYLEAAPYDVGSFVFGYYRLSKEINRHLGTSSIIGTGKYNTQRLVQYMDIEGKAYSCSSGETMEEYAARKCIDFEFGGYEDWYLPSKDELYYMYWNLYKKGLGSFASNGVYWSSSEDDADGAWAQNFYYGTQGSNDRKYEYRVRPIRAF